MFERGLIIYNILKIFIFFMVDVYYVWWEKNNDIDVG